MAAAARRVFSQIVVLGAVIGVLGALVGGGKLAHGAGGELKLTVIDGQSHKPIPCRIHLRGANGKPRLNKNLPWFHDHFVIDGATTLKLPRGNYQFEIERGPEYTNVTGHFVLEDTSKDEKTITLKRAVNMAAEGWWSSDLKMRRPTRDLKLLMAAEDLHVAAVLASDNKKGEVAPFAPTPVGDDGSFYLFGQSDRREGNDLLYLAPVADLTPPVLDRKRSPVESLLAFKNDDNIWSDFARAASWDLPVALALGKVDSIELANDQICRSQMIAVEGDFRRRDKTLTGPYAPALWTQQIYYHALNSGLRITPTAGSGSGAAPNPVGYNRVYVYTGDDTLTVESWAKALKAGQTIVTNGPLIRPNVRGQLPGYVFQAEPGEELSLDISLSLTARDPLSYLEVVRNGEIERSVPIEEWAKSGELDPIVFRESGWFLIRAITEIEGTYRFVTTAPYYVEIGQPRVSKRSAQFFLDWTNDRVAMLKKSPVKRDMTAYDEAVRFWEERVAGATAE